MGLFLLLAPGCGGASAESAATPTAATPAPSPSAEIAATAPASPPPAPVVSSAPATPATGAGGGTPKDVEGANFQESNVNMGKHVLLNDILCKAQPGALQPGLNGLLAVGDGFPGKQSAIAGCVEANVKTRVAWTSAGGKMTKVKASGSDAKANKCLETALEGAPTKSPEAVCAATLWRDK